jgi:hypothetical protein
VKTLSPEALARLIRVVNDDEIQTCTDAIREYGDARVAEEREACALVAVESMKGTHRRDAPMLFQLKKHIAEQIRSRGAK